MSAIRPDLAALARRFDAPPLTRFAPSPTGYLHLGHVVNAIYVWGIAGALGGRVLLRVEDHDRIRCRPVFEAALLEDLDWLGFEAASGRRPVSRQSDRPDRYEQALTRLRHSQHVYACACSRKDIGADRYPGTCRNRGLPEGTGRGFRVQLRDTTESFDDALVGRVREQPAAEHGDLLIKDRDGHWTYQFAVVVDDLEDRVDLVIRGVDLIDSTGRQLQLGRMLGRSAQPQFLHHPLIRHPGGEKLSKAAGDMGVRELRESGVVAAEVIGRAAAAVGLVDAPRPIAAAAVGELFHG